MRKVSISLLQKHCQLRKTEFIEKIDMSLLEPPTHFTHEELKKFVIESIFLLGDYNISQYNEEEQDDVVVHTISLGDLKKSLFVHHSNEPFPQINKIVSDGFSDEEIIY